MPSKNDALFELFNDFIVKDDKKAIFTIKSLNYTISEKDNEKMSNFSFSLFLSDIKYTTIYKDEADTTPSSSLFT